MRKISQLLIATIFYLISSSAFAATTWYVRDDGGTSTQCTGTTNAAYPGSGTGQACAFSHPSWAIGAPGTTQLMAGGDTLIIKNTTAAGGQAKYMIGLGMPNTTSGNCASSYSYQCGMSIIPSGPDAAHPTRILGSNYASCQGAVDSSMAQLWGTQGLGTTSGNGIFTLSNVSHIDIECLELTDHSNCGLRTGSPICSESWGGTVGTWARKAIYAHGGTDFTFKNLDMHGFADKALHMGGINGITFSYVMTDGNYFPGWDADVGESGNESAMTGTINVDHVKVRFNGCSEAYPRTAMSTYPIINSSDYSNCVDENESNPGYGDGWGFFITQGDWNITNSEFSHNASDGLDLLYKNGGNVNVDKSLFEGNTGNQLKVSGVNLNVSNSVLLSNCDYLKANSKVKSPSTYNQCRADASPLIMTPLAGSTVKIYNNTFLTATPASGGGSSGFDGSPGFELVQRYYTANGTESYTFKNNIFYYAGGVSHSYPVTYNAPNSNGDYLTGAALTAWNNQTVQYTDSYNFPPGGPSGTGNITSNPLWVSSIVTTLDSNLSKVYLQSGSPAKGTGVSGLTFWNTSSDYNSFAQNSPVDMGALQYGSTPSGGGGPTCTANGSFCSLNGDCCSTYCVSNACSSTPACINNGNACSLPADCCSGNCASGFCAVASSGGTTTAGIAAGLFGKTSTTGKTILF
jgi:hypothetical protein